MSQILTENQFGTIKKIQLSDTIAGIEIQHPNCTAKLSLYGGQVLGWQPTGQNNVFWLSDSCQYQTGKAIRGGIPLCWPWFGAHHNDPKNHAGNHGFARQQIWKIETLELSEENAVIVLTWQGQNKHALFPIACQLKQTLTFGKTFSQQLTMTNLSDDSIDYTAALHSYFQVSHPQKIKISTLSTLSFDDKLTGESRSAEVFINGVGPVDRVYHCLTDENNQRQSQTMQIIDSQWQRTIEITSDNCQQWVFWNPGRQGAENMSDVHENGENEFVCLEAANTNPQQLTANSSVTIGQKISVFSCS